MIARLVAFYRLIVRPLYREPARTSLTVLAVALGVAVVLAIELAGQAAAGSFHSSVETLAGDNDLEITAAGGVPEDVVGKLATMPYQLRVHARVEDFAVLVPSRVSVPLVGADLIAEGHDYAAKLGGRSGFLDDVGPDTVWVGPAIGKRTGEKIRLQLNDKVHDYTVGGVLETGSAGDNVVVMDIAQAQRALGRIGRIDRVLVKAPAQADISEWQARLRSALPVGVLVRPQGSGTDENRKMLAAFRWNLRILSYVALVVGAFLIYNTISVSVVRRRPEIGVVRALGATQVAVLGAFVGEAACFGVAGALVGIPLGRAMASGAVRLMAATVQTLYVSARPEEVHLTVGSVMLAFAIGIGVAVLSALSPARYASFVSPVEAMARGRREFTAKVHKWRDLWLAAAFGVLGGTAAVAPPIRGMPVLGYIACVLLIAAMAFAIPALVSACASVSSRLIAAAFGAEGLLATRSLAGSLRRTSVLVGALATAIAMMTAVGIMVGSFRETVAIWIEDQLPADLYMRPAGAAAADRHPTLSPALADEIGKLPGVSDVDRLRAYEISYDGLPATLASIDLSALRTYRGSDFFSGRPARQVLAELRGAHEVIVSEPFANKHHVKRGDEITLPLGESRVQFRVADVYYDYASERGYIMVDRNILMRYLPDPAPSNMAVYLKPGADLTTVREEVQKAAAGSRVLVFSNRDIKREAIRIFDRTFAITYALEAVAIVVAVMGIAGALLALVIDRRRELGLLRFLGAATGQVRKMILFEAGLLGLLANFAGLALGVVLSLVLIFVINKQSFGWTIRFHWPVAVLVGALGLVYAATVLAGLYPARIAMQLNPIEVIHEE